MSDRNTKIIWLLAGVFIGLAVPGMLLLSGAVTMGKSMSESPAPTSQRVQPIAMSDRISPETLPPGPSRDMTGDCVFSGVVSTASGIPVSGASVYLRLIDEPWGTAHVHRNAETAADGTWRIEGLTADAEYQIFAWAPGTRITDIESPACGTTVDLSLEPGAALLLNFVDAGGNSVPEVQVEIAGTALWPARQIRADRQGALDIVGLAPGSYSIAAWKDNVGFFVSETLELAEGDEIEFEARLIRAEPSVIEVRSAEGDLPLEGAFVTLIPGASPLLSRMARSDRQGLVQLSGLSPVGDHVQVSAPGYVSSTGAIIKPGAHHRVSLRRGIPIRGTLLDERGQPISGGLISVQSSNNATLIAGDDRISSQERLHANSGGRPSGFCIEKDACIVGPSRIPLPRLKDTRTPAAGQPDGPSDENGSFQLSCPAPGEYLLSATHPDFYTHAPAQIALDAAGSLSGDAVIRMKKGALLSVKIIGQGGGIVPDARISISDDEGRFLARSNIGNDGIAAFTGLPLSFRVEAEAEGFVPVSRLFRGRSGRSSEMVIVMTKADRVLRGRVVDHLGRPIPDASVQAQTSIRGTPHMLSARTDVNGAFLIEGVAASRYQMQVEVDGSVRARLAEAATNTDLTLMLDPGGTSPASSSLSASVPLLPSHESHGMAGENTPETTRDSGRGDNLGVIRSDGGRVSDSYTVGESVQTPFGPADQLVTTAPPPGRGGLPIGISGSAGHVVISAVAPGSEVAAAGLRTRARILRIDGVDIQSVAQARAALSGRIGSVVMLEVIQEGEPLSVVVQRVRVE